MPGEEAGWAPSLGAQRASYARLVLTELSRRKFYPSAARAARIGGSVGVAFLIGPSGRVISSSITRSSGNEWLDAAALSILAALHAPPPPGGRFSTRTNILFHP